MTTLTPSEARTLWLALADNAARLVIEAHTLFPSPRSQSLIVLAKEEVGKALWVEKVFRNVWSSRDETPRDLSDLAKHGSEHWKKLMQAANYAEDTEGYVANLRFFRKHAEVELIPSAPDVDPQQYVEYLRAIARDADKDKQRGFYVDLGPDGSLSVPHEIERPDLEEHIAATGLMVDMLLFDDLYLGDLLASDKRARDDRVEEIRARLRPITGVTF